MPGSPPADLARYRAERAAAVRHGNQQAAIDAARDLAAAKLERHIRAVVDGAPPLSTEQRDRLAALLRPGGDIA